MKQFINKWYFKKQKRTLIYLNGYIEREKLKAPNQIASLLFFFTKISSRENLDINYKSKKYQYYF